MFNPDKTHIAKIKKNFSNAIDMLGSIPGLIEFAYFINITSMILQAFTVYVAYNAQQYSAIKMPLLFFLGDLGLWVLLHEWKKKRELLKSRK